MESIRKLYRKHVELISIFSINFFILSLSYRLFNIFTIIPNDGLLDLRGYYRIASEILTGTLHATDVIKTTMGPPFVVIPFLPFALLPFYTANYILTLLNICCFFITFFLLWKKFIKHITPIFWLFSGVLFFSFPISYSLGMGNPMGIVTLGCYAFVLFPGNKKLSSFLTIYSIFLKIFPIVSVIAYIVIKPNDEKLRKYLYLFLLLFVFFSFLLIPHESWSLYTKQLFHQYLAKSSPDVTLYNQSFISSVFRMGIHLKLLFIPFIIGLFTYVLLLIKNIKSMDFTDPEKVLLVTTTLLATMLLIHPFPWQYYFSILVPFLLLRIAKGEYIYLLSLLLISIDGNKISILFLKGVIDSSQFIATVFLLGSIIWYSQISKKTS